MSEQTPLYLQHRAAAARMVDFHGWRLPLHYGSQLQEHIQVRRAAGLFDSAYQCIVDLSGEQAESYLRQLLANDVARLNAPGQGLYSAMLNEDGGVIDDLRVYRLADGVFRLLINSPNRENDLAWLGLQAQRFNVELQERCELTTISLHGPDALAILVKLLSAEDGQRLASLPPLCAVKLTTTVGDAFIASSSALGEQGYDIVLAQADTPALWAALLAQGAAPCGLGARDSLRLEAGVNLYGQEMDDDTSPLAANMGESIAWQPAERAFIGRNELEIERQQPQARLIGLLLEGRGVLRSGQQLRITDSNGQQHDGRITSGSFSPTLGQGIALARIPAVEVAAIEVAMRKGWIRVNAVQPAFVQHGQSIIRPL